MKIRSTKNWILIFTTISLICSSFVNAEEASIKNNIFMLSFDSSTGTWDCMTNKGEKIISNAEFLIITEDGKKYYSSSPNYRRNVKISNVDDEMGSGQKLEIEFISNEQTIPQALIRLNLYDDKSYFTVEVKAQNSTSEKIIIREIQPLKLDAKRGGMLNFHGSYSNVSCLIDGYSQSYECKVYPLSEKKDIVGYTTTAFYDLTTKKSMIIGSTNNEKSVTPIAFHLLDESKSGYSSFDFTLSSYFIYCPLQKGESVSTGPVMVNLPDNVFDGLEEYADKVAEYNNIVLDRGPFSGWCSWYYAYPDITEKEVLLNVEFLKNNLKDYGLEYIQIDRGRVLTGTDWLTTNSKFPHDMKWMADKIHNAGFKAGIWTAPFWLGRDSKEYNPDWILDKISTEPRQEGKRRRHWASWGDVLDGSNKEVTDYMKRFVNTLVHDWDYDYLKNDFLSYGFPEVKNIDKNFLKYLEVVDAKKIPRKDISITPVEAYQNSIRAIKEAAGDETFIMGCNSILFNSGGSIHAARVGGDIQSKLCVSWECGTSKTVRTSAKRYYYNGRILWIDPDCLVTWDPVGRGVFTLNEARVRASLASFFGGMIMMSDKMYDLPPERVDLLKRVTPVYPKSARPLDLFEKDMPEIWLWDIEKDFGSWNVLGVFNYDSETMKREISYDYLGLDTTKQYIMYDFWNKKMPTRSSRYNFRSFMPFDKEMALELEPHSCKVIAIHEKLPHPQVISTNRHLTQGGVDLFDVSWDEKSKTLSGISDLVKNDDYELVVTLPANLDFISAESQDDVLCIAHLDDPDVDRYNTVKVQLKSPESQKVNWSLSFK